MEDGSTVSIIQKPSKSNSKVQLPEKQQFSRREKTFFSQHQDNNRVRLDHATQTWVEVATKRSETILVDPHKPLYANVICIVRGIIAIVEA